MNRPRRSSAFLWLAGAAIAALRWPVAAPAQDAPIPPQPAPSAAQSLPDDLQVLSLLVQNETATQETRDEAARRLHDRGSSESLQLLHDALTSLASPGGQLAASRALSESVNPDARFIDPLFALLQLGRSRLQTEAASEALGQFKNNPDVLNRLIELARNGSREAVRIGAIDTLGLLTDKRAAEALVRILQDDMVPVPQRLAAANALVNMTGLNTFGTDQARWRQWWNDNAPIDPDQWERTVLIDRATRLGALQSQRDRSIPELQRVLFEQYRLGTEAQRAEALMRYLRSDADAIRVVGARIAYDDSANNLPVPNEARDRLRELIGDSSPDVRRDVATAIWALADVAAVEPLRAQLRRETVPAVKIQIVQALAKLGDIRCVPDMLPLLNPTSRGVAEATADALRILGNEIREKDPVLARQVAGKLREALTHANESIGKDRFVEMVIDAMGALREESLRPVYQDLLQQAVSPAIRRAVLRAIGDLRDTNDADIILNALDDDDPTIRLEAARALRWTASPQHVRALYPRLAEAVEPNAEVREALWVVLQSLFPSMAIEELEHWATRFENDGQVERRLTVLKAARDTLIRQGNENLLAYTRINLGATMMRLERFSEAAVEFQQALNYFRSQPDSMVTNQLVEQLLTARLRAEQYTDAVQFAAGMIQTREGYQEDVGPAIRKEAERLLQAQQFDKVQRLIAEVKKMQPPLAVRFTTALDVLDKQARERATGQ